MAWRGKRAGVSRGVGLAALGYTIALGTISPAHAVYTIDWYTIDGGGATELSAGALTLGSTVGQPDAGELSGGSYVLSGGFWTGGAVTVGVGDEGPDGPDVPGAPPVAFRFHGARPNPLIGQTAVAFDLAEARHVRAVVFDASGRAVRTLLDGARPAGRHRLDWDGSDDAGHRVAGGIYFLAFEAGELKGRQKLVVLQ